MPPNIGLLDKVDYAVFILLRPPAIDFILDPGGDVCRGEARVLWLTVTLWLLLLFLIGLRFQGIHYSTDLVCFCNLLRQMLLYELLLFLSLADEPVQIIL